MNIFPLKQINLQQWKKKVDCTSMYTIPAEDDALPVLQQIEQILTRLMTLPLQQTIDESQVEYFFTNVFPPVCQKIIRSRYFKNPQVLKLSNSILQKSVYLTAKYLEIAIKFPKFLQTLTIVLSDQYYFKTNNQMTFMIYPYSYFPQVGNKMTFKEGDFVDVLKTGTLYQKVSWSQGQVLEVDQYEVEVAYLLDGMDKKIKLKKDSPQLTPFKTKSHTFQWRKNLKKGDLVDIQDSFGTWYNGTVVEIIQRQQGKKNVKVTLKVYNEMGNKTDQNGQSYYGFSDYQQIIDFTSPKLAPYCTISKQFCYQSNKVSSYDVVEDINDYQFIQINGTRIYAFPRKKNLSQFQFQTINGFGQLGGFDKYIEYLEKQVNFDVFSYFIKGISGVTPYLHRKVVKEVTQKLRLLFERYFFSQQTSKTYTKQQSQMAFSGLKVLQKRIFSSDNVSKFQNSLKMRLAEACLQSQTIKSKLQGLNQLKDIVRSVTYVSDKNKYIKDWVKNNKIFEKIYITNSHVQLIKKSQQFFKYLITENILEVNDLQKLYKIAQKGDFQSRVSLYKLFQQVSHIFKKDHVDFLIDTILESDVNLILNEDIDLLHELSRFSNYFPLQKVINFFESLILGQNKVKQINDYAIKKYSQIVAKNQDVKKIRNSIIKKFLQKLQTHDILQITKVLKGIFQGIGTGEWGKKDLNQILSEQKIDQVLVQVLKNFKQKPQFGKNFNLILDFLLFIYKISHRIKINIKVLMNIWDLLQGDQDKQKQFYRWSNQVMKCEQGFQNTTPQQLQKFYRKLFSLQKLPEMQGSQMELAKNFFVQINKKAKYITYTNSFKDRQLEKQYKRKVQMKSLKLIDELIQMIYQVKSEAINTNILNFFIQLYTSKDNSQPQIDQFLTKLLKDFKIQFEQKNFRMLSHTIKLLEVVINDSQKSVQTNIKSLISKKQPDFAKFVIINEVNYVSSDTYKKIDVVLPMNMPVIRLRKTLGEEFNINWKEIKIVSHKQIQDYDNSRTLKEIKLNPNQPLTISRRIIFSSNEQELILNDQMNPKAVRCFRVIFQKYSTDGKMDKNQCNSFTAKCLGSSCSAKYYNQKITSLYNKYDDDNDGLLTFENFLQFYEDAAKDRPSTVISNLKSFDVRGDFKFINQPQDDGKITKFPRNIISEQPNVYDILFELLHIKEVASYAFELLQRLPVSKAMQEQLLTIESVEDIKKNLQTPDLYELFYKLNIIQYLAHSNQLQTPTQKQWHAKFIELNGYEQLYQCVNKIVQNSQKQNNQSQQVREIIRQIAETSCNLLNQYWVQCFSKDPTKTRLSLAFISADQDIDDKMQYLIFQRFFKSQKKLQPRPSKLPKTGKLYLWKGKSKQQISQFVKNQLSRKWTEICKINKSSETSQKIYNIAMLINKLIDSINILYMNQNPEKIINLISDLLDNVPNSELTKRLYCLILSQCFFVNQSKYQGVYIKQLFKNLTKSTITSELFRVLAVLVSRFGISSKQKKQEEDSSQESTRKVLLQNVLNNNNQLTVQGCAKLLTNFSLQSTPLDVIQKIWSQRLFNPNTVCQKQQSKAALYELILKICDDNPKLTNQLIKSVLKTLQQSLKNLKITYCNQFKQRSTTGYAGLKNLGSTCYINSMIQQLFMNKTFRYCILRADDKQKQNIIQVLGNKDQVRTVDDNLLHQLQRIFAYLQITNRIDFAPKDFCVAYKPFGESVNVLIQQDVQQFVSMFFDRLQAGLTKTPFKKLVQDFYSGKTANLFDCHDCKKTKKVQQNFHCISLQVKTSKTLAQSFNRFGLGQMISDYKCDFCQKKVDVTKKTRISKAPKILIIHLQRIVFNYDTFINQKITTKHTFPHNFNLFQSTLQYLQNKDKGNATDQPPKQFQYSLIGIICHSGTADSGHYISYIKTAQNKWIQFNDTQVTPFNASNIESQCFGGYYSSNTFDDDYFQEKKQSSKSAYLLIYQRQGANTVQIILNTQLQACKTEKQKQKVKNEILRTLDLKQVAQKIAKKVQKSQTVKSENQKVSENQKSDLATQNISQSHEQSSSAPEDSQKETKQLLQQKQLQIRRHQSEDNIQTQIKQTSDQRKQQTKQQKVVQSPKDVVIFVQDPVSKFMPISLKEEITRDNQIHYFEKCLSSTAFTKFFSQLISKPNDLYDNILPVCQKLTFGFWLKSQGFKDLLGMLDGILKRYPAGFESVVTNNPVIINLLIESSDSQIRTAMATFLAKAIADTIQSKKISIYENPQDPIFKFLDKLLSLLPSTVSKCWTKFGQYFEFWYELSCKGQVLVQYMINRQIIKHFMDYFLDTKSPLKIYSTKRQHQIGSSYANPNFSMLLKCVFSLLQQRMIYNQKNKSLNKILTSTPEQQILLMSHESLQKLISDSYQNVAAQLVKQICPNNLPASQKAAIVLLKGISKSNNQSIQPYLDVVHQFILIDDQYQDLRMKWVIGKQTLAVSAQSQKITALHAYSIDQRLYNYDSSIFIQSGSSMLQAILAYWKRIQSFAMLITKQLLKLCDQNKKVRNYVFSLESPTLTTTKYADFFKTFIQKYYEDHRKSYGFYSSSPGFNRQQLGKYVKQLYTKVINKIQADQQQQKQQKISQKIVTAIQIKQKQKQNQVIEIQDDEQKQHKEKHTKVQSPTIKVQQQTAQEGVNQQDVANLIKMSQIVHSDVKTEQKSGKANLFPQQYAFDEDDDDWNKIPQEEQYKRGSVCTNDSKPTRNTENKVQYSINVRSQMPESGNKNYMRDQMGFSDQEVEQPLVKSKQNSSQKESVVDYKSAWHPVKFEYIPVKVIQVDEKLPNIKIQQHQSIVTYVQTKPTGYTNRSFSSSSGVIKISQRMLPETMNNSRQVKAHGFYVKNSGRESVRIQTNDGCAFCKANQNIFVWADSIIKVWESQRSIDWPKWRLYPSNPRQGN